MVSQGHKLLEWRQSVDLNYVMFVSERASYLFVFAICSWDLV
jgi:hypothetical protein